VRPHFAFAAGLAVAVFAAAIGIVASQQIRGEATYETASLREPAAAAELGAHLAVVFSPEVSYAEIEDAMHAIGATVESGPSPNGVVQLRLARGTNPSQAAKRLESGDLDVAEYAQPAP
jgi:hypothetical protein